MARILVIDDEESIRKPVRILLQSRGHEIFEAEDGEAGMAALAEQKFDLVITDVVMPIKGGLETVLNIDRQYPEVKLIVMSGKIPTQADSIQNLAKQFGVTSVLQKPFKKSELLSAVNTAVGS